MRVTKFEKIIASKKCKLKDFDNDYYIALHSLSMRVDCPMCHAVKGIACYGAENTPAHKSRMRLLRFVSRIAYGNLRYSLDDRSWKGDYAIVKVNGKGKYIIVTGKEYITNRSKYKTLHDLKESREKQLPEILDV